MKQTKQLIVVLSVSALHADASLLDGGDGELLWKVAVHRDADWTRPANDVIAGVTRKLARKFPYQPGTDS